MSTFADAISEILEEPEPEPEANKAAPTPPIPTGGDGRLTMLEVGTVGFGIWTVAFWLSLLGSLGWLPVLGLFSLLGTGLWMWLGRPRPNYNLTALDLGTPALWAVWAAFVIPLWAETTDNVLVMAAVIGLCAAAAVTSGTPTLPTRQSLVFLGAATVASIIAAWAYVTSWPLFIAIVVLLGTAVIALSWTETAAEPDLPSAAGWRAGGPTLAAGAVLALWAFTSPQPNPDDVYYLNKAGHYAQSPLRFFFEDELYGVDGLRHLSTSDYISSLEPLIGFFAAAAGWSASITRAAVFAPLAAFAIPAALRYAGRALDARRPGLVALVAALPLLLFRGSGDALLLIDKGAQGKGMAALVLVPVLLGSSLRLADALGAEPGAEETASTIPGRASVVGRRLLVVVAAAVGLFGMTGSIVVAALGLLSALIAALAVHARFESFQAPLWLLVPFGVLLALGVIGFLIEPATEFGNSHSNLYATAESSWIRRAVTPIRDADLSASVFGLLIPGALVATLFLAPTRRARLVLAAIAVVTFGILYNPAFFNPVIVDVLGLNWLSWRFGWMLPLGLGIGLLADVLSRRHGWLGAGLVAAGIAAVILTGTPEKIDLRGPTHDLAPVWEDIAQQIIVATPEGGRYLAPDNGELSVAVLTPDIHPTYGRKLYLDDVPKFNDSPEFHYEERLQLLFWIRGDQRGTADPAMLLDTVEVDTVCLPKGLYESPLGQEVQASYELQYESNRHCDVWTRSAPFS